MKKLRNTLGTLAAIVVAFAVADIGGAAYLLGYSLNPDPERTDTAQHLRQLYDLYPEARGWMDSLQRVGALRDTFVTAANGERQHAYYISNGSQRTAVVLHGWRDNALKFLYLARLYDRLLGYNVVINYRSESSKKLSDDIAAKLEADYGVETLVVRADVN